MAKGDPTGWFEQLYREAKADAAAIPWADGKPNPKLTGLWPGIKDCIPARKHSSSAVDSEMMPSGFRSKASEGFALIITRAREENEPDGQMPWPLTRHEINGITKAGLTEVSFEDYYDDETPRVRRFRALYSKLALNRSEPTGRLRNADT